MVFELLLGRPARRAPRTTRLRFWPGPARLGVTAPASPARGAAGARPLPSRDGGASRCLHPMQSVRPRLPRGAGQRRDRHGGARHPRRWSSISTIRWARTCVACGECVQACPTGALLPEAVVDAPARGNGRTARSTSVCPYCGVGCQMTFRIEDDRIVAVEGRTARRTRTGSASRAASASITCTTRTG